jgi:hypothetical protein
MLQRGVNVNGARPAGPENYWGNLEPGVLMKGRPVKCLINQVPRASTIHIKTPVFNFLVRNSVYTRDPKSHGPEIPSYREGKDSHLLNWKASLDLDWKHDGHKRCDPGDLLRQHCTKSRLYSQTITTHVLLSAIHPTYVPVVSTVTFS